jgi:hypothetical protein
VTRQARPPTTTDGALLSEDGVYRYWLRRQLGQDPAAPALVFVMLNPSTADATTDDPTIRRCKAFAARDGWGALEVVNLYALRSTDPAALRRAADPVGPNNDRHILVACLRAVAVVAAWGAPPTLAAWDRAARVTGMLEREGLRLVSLGVTGSGAPRHPLRLAATTPFRPWSLL